MAFKMYLWTPTRLLQLAMGLKSFKCIAHVCCSSLLADISLEKRSPPAKDGLATATRMIKPARLAHACVEQFFLYPWMCFISGSDILRSQNECLSTTMFSKFHSRSPYCCVSNEGGSVMITLL